jgi:hypothetical protein
MEKYLVEVPHDRSEQSCIEAIQAFLHSGSHFLVNADWGCEDNVHKAWIVLEAEDKEQVKLIVPANYRSNTKVTRLSKFSREKIDAIVEEHKK